MFVLIKSSIFDLILESSTNNHIPFNSVQSHRLPDSFQFRIHGRFVLEEFEETANRLAARLSLSPDQDCTY